MATSQCDSEAQRPRGDRNEQVIPTGAEGREIERQGREVERQRADGAEAKARQLAERLRAMGINPDESTAGEREL